MVLRGSMNDGCPELVDIRVKRGTLVPYWEPHEFVVLTPLLSKSFRCRWRLAHFVLNSFAYRNCKYLEFHRLRLKLCGGSSGCYIFGIGADNMCIYMFSLACLTLMAAPGRGRGRGRGPQSPVMDDLGDEQQEFLAAMTNMANTA
ncbi:hypothetical protein PIB30_065919 [Stylosanthes scabra]|uniref:Uncharacterized protein n=1 Tax=Stylosanthes scabra TaxID=79078 RepID=A0ABU6UKW5_9FABA|nr:hypothetical protein [Stylosanthes scabra]